MEASQAPGTGPNAPHSNAPDVPPDAEDFFGAEEGDSEQEPADPPRETAPEGASRAAQEWAAEAAANGAEGESEPEASEEPQEGDSGAEEPAGEPEAPFEADAREHDESQQAGEQPAAQEGPKTPERDYRIFNELALTPQVLKMLLKEAEESGEPSPRIAYFELPLVRDRTIKGAIGKAYKEHRETIGEKPGLAICPDRNWSVKHPRPRTKPIREAIEID